MNGLATESFPLIRMIDEICGSPPNGEAPWNGDLLRKCLKRANRYAPDQAAFYLEFIESAQELVPDDENEILKRFGLQSLLTEARVQADDRKVRDHLMHVTQVFLAGWIILNGCRMFRWLGDDWQPYGWALTREDRFKRLNRCWLYAGLLHDCGYSVQSARKSAEDEIFVSDLFGEMYRTSNPGDVEWKRLYKASEDVWTWRNACKGLGGGKPPREIREIVKSQCKRADHGIVGGVAIWEEAKRRKGELENILKAAAMATAQHSFAKFAVIQADRGQEKLPLSWLIPDLEQEPISVMLILCDELQEWGRERPDIVFARRWGVEPPAFERTELIDMKVDNTRGLTITAKLRRILRPEDRPLRDRFLRQAEREIARKRRWLRKMFPADSSGPDFSLHLQVKEWVDHCECSNAWEVGWSRSIDGGLESISKDVNRDNARLHEKPFTMSVDLAADPDSEFAPTGVTITFEDGRASFQPSGGPGNAGIRLVVLGPGARGKSTLLQQLALFLQEQRRGAEVIYIEQLPERPIDLEQELERLHQKGQGREIFLLVDHLDRLVEEPTGEYWLDQLAQLPHWGWLNVVLASRTDEFDRYLQGPLCKAFRKAELKPASLQSLFGGETDSKGRVRPATILKQIQATTEQFSRATRFALAFGHSRSRAASGAEGLSIEDGVSFRGGRLFHVDDRGRGRFVHDVVQDALSAAGLVMQLAERNGGDQTVIALCRTLQDLPRDVPRMLFDLVSARKTRHLSSGVLRAASGGLVRGMLRERSTQQWLADTGRQDQAFDSLKAFDEARGDEGEPRLVAKMHLGYALYMRSKIQDFMEDPTVSMEEVANHAEPAIRNMAEGACIAEQLIASTELGQEGDHSRQWYMTRLLFLVDQIFVMLERLFYTPHLTEFSIRLAHDLMGLFRQIKTHEPLQEGWVRGLLDEFCRARTEDDADRVHIRIYSDAKKVADQKHMKGFLDLRLCFVATHVGTRMLEHVFSRTRTPKPPNKGKLAEARRWYYQALARWEQMLRRMTDEGSERHVEIQASAAQVLSYIGVIWRGISESYLFEIPCGQVSRKLVNRILVAHRHHEDAWHRVDRRRTLAERLPVNYRTALAALVSGRLVRQVVFEGLEPDAAEDALQKLAQKAIDKFLEKAEIHPRAESAIAKPRELWAQHEKILGKPSDLVDRLKRSNMEGYYDGREHSV